MADRHYKSVTVFKIFELKDIKNPNLHEGSPVEVVSIAEVDILGNYKNNHPAERHILGVNEPKKTVVRIHHKAGTFRVKIIEY